MACMQCLGCLAGILGWIGLLIATCTNDWVVTCDIMSSNTATCAKLEELGSKGLWADCVNKPGIYHCRVLTDILNLPVHIQACRALMIFASVMGLPAVLVVLTTLPCIKLGSDMDSTKHARNIAGGVLVLLMAVCALIATVWFPVSSYHQMTIVSFGYSLYLGWIGALLCLFGGFVIICCSGSSDEQTENSFYYSSQGAAASPTHAKSAHV
ncbi:claudin-11 [Protopterus annectens]|uniref:claudin-11 n=1 Tax=Protopterus annectens TaxID=7888 RepID=UPI001CFB85F2|nr:claudin-11 [Protopterus annectens]